MNIPPRELLDVCCDLYHCTYFMWQPLTAAIALRLCTYPWRRSCLVGKSLDFIAKWSLVALIGFIVVTAAK